MNNNNPGPNLNGPEAMPLREYVKSFMIVVCVYDDDRLVRSETIDYGIKEHRVWLGKCTFWAVSNHYTVETMAAEDYNK